MTKTTKTTSKKAPRKKAEVVEIAEEIVATVVQPKVEEAKVTAPEPKKKEEVVQVAYVKNKVPKNIRVKATQNARGVFGRINYEIKAGEVYELPSNLANWLISVGRAI
tara:strand:+ start:1407 stop:1730 length:324 start_codon:yes stop_codon:yes gene_type:complete